MVDQNDPKQIASKYLDLWLDHWERSARDPEAVDAMARMVQEAMTQQAEFQRSAAQGWFGVHPGAAFASLGPWLELMQQYAHGAAEKNDASEKDVPDRPAAEASPDKPANRAPANRANGTAAVGPAPGADSKRVVELLQRLAELESRIADLERVGAARPTRSKRTKPAG